MTEQGPVINLEHWQYQFIWLTRLLAVSALSVALIVVSYQIKTGSYTDTNPMWLSLIYWLLGCALVLYLFAMNPFSLAEQGGLKNDLAYLLWFVAFTFPVYCFTRTNGLDFTGGIGLLLYEWSLKTRISEVLNPMHRLRALTIETSEKQGGTCAH